MRSLVVRLLAWTSGVCLGVGLELLLFTLMGLATGWRSSVVPPTLILLSNALLILVAWLWLRRRVGEHRVWRPVVSSAMFVAAVILLLSMIPGYANTKEKAYMAAMKSDLRNLVDAEESFYADSSRFTVDTVKLNYRTSTGVKDLKITLTRDGWTASVHHERVGNMCAIYVGRTPLPPATHQGEPACTEPPFDYTIFFVIAAFLGAAALFAGLANLAATRL